MIGGGILGHFHHKGLGLTDEDRERIAAELAGGKAAIGILVEEDAEAAMISRKLTDLGGIAETHEVTEEASTRSRPPRRVRRRRLCPHPS